MAMASVAGTELSAPSTVTDAGRPVISSVNVGSTVVPGSVTASVASGRISRRVSSDGSSVLASANATALATSSDDDPRMAGLARRALDQLGADDS